MGAQREEGGDRQRERDRTEHSWYVMVLQVIVPYEAAAQNGFRGAEGIGESDGLV